jgi:hypothetical protein
VIAPRLRANALLAVALLAPALAGAQARETRFASRNAVEKVCLTLEHDGALDAAVKGRFRMASSNCTVDRDFTGTWTRRGDTLSLTTDRRPSFRVESFTESGTDTARTRLVLRSADPQLLAGVRVYAAPDSSAAGGRPARGALLGRGPELALDNPVGALLLALPGMAPQVFRPLHPNAAITTVTLRFEDLHAPALVDDRWLPDGRRLTFVPRAGSLRSEPLELRRGQRCFYRQNR